jgi:hypothetical protein
MGHPHGPGDRGDLGGARGAGESHKPRQTRGRVTQAPFTSLNPFRKASLRRVTTRTNYTDNIVRLGLNYRLN